MGQTLHEVAEELRNSHKKVQLIYAFNGSGKTRLSREFKDLVAPRSDDEEQQSRSKILYYNAYTEDLFYWDNDLQVDAEPKLRIQPNSFTNWLLSLLKEQGLDGNSVNLFQAYTDPNLTPFFSEDLSEVTFSLSRGDDATLHNVKISKGEESNFIWSVFNALLEQVVATRNVVDMANRETTEFDQLEYIVIDDPVSSLDENHLIQLGVNLAELITSSNSNLKFIISTHNPLFYNVLFNELNSKACHMLTKNEDGTFELENKPGRSNQSFSYHLHLKQIIEQAIANNSVKTASFLGYANWPDLLDSAPGNKEAYLKRITHFNSHRTLAGEEVAPPTEPEKQMVGLLLKNLIENYGFWKQGEQNG